MSATKRLFEEVGFDVRFDDIEEDESYQEFLNETLVTENRKAIEMFEAEENDADDQMLAQIEIQHEVEFFQNLGHYPS